MSLVLHQEYDSSKFTLYAVNIMLQMIGELPITDDVELAEILEAQVAQQVLTEVKKDVLGQGWDFNMDSNYFFAQDADGYISIPANVLDITDAQGDIIMRDWRLYSKSNQSAKFEAPQAMSVKWDMDFNSLTHPIRNYITIKAARIFALRTVTDATVASYSQEEEHTAYISAKRSEGFTGQYNMLASGDFGATYKVR